MRNVIATAALGPRLAASAASARNVGTVTANRGSLVYRSLGPTEMRADARTAGFRAGVPNFHEEQGM